MVYKGTFIQNAIFTFKDTWWKKSDNHITSVMITLIEGSQNDLKFDIALGSIKAGSDGIEYFNWSKQGREVILYWEVLDMVPHVTFYTDSNSYSYI